MAIWPSSPISAVRVTTFTSKEIYHSLFSVLLSCINCININDIISEKNDFITYRGHQRLSAIRKLKGLHVAPHLLLLLYKSIIQPILLYCSTCFFNIITVKNRSKLTSISRKASKIIGLPTPILTDMNSKAIVHIASTIEQDINHPLNHHLIPLPSGLRYRTLCCRRARLARSLIPSTIETLNTRPRRGRR